MRKISLTITTMVLVNFAYGQNWNLIKDSISPTNEKPLEYDSIYRQPLSTLGWEDGIHISKDGLNLYCTYVPIDFLSFVLNGDLPNNFTASYLRGAPTFGMDLINNPIGATEWLHADILYSHRNTLADSFNIWSLSNMARGFYSEGAPTPIFINNTNSVEFMLFTSNDNPTNNTDIWIINNTLPNPLGTGTPMPSPINTLNTEDNPHLVRIDSNQLVLFFDSDNLPGGIGDIDIWVSVSSNNGLTWSTPSNVSTLNTPDKEHQPFLHQDFSSGEWFLYYAAPHTDGKLAIFRAHQMNPNNWDNWETPELVVSAGNSAGIGEPTLTENGDLSFVLIYEDPNTNSIYNHFDADPWFLKKKETSTGFNRNDKDPKISIYPNPTNGVISIDLGETKSNLNLKLTNALGQVVLTKNYTSTNYIHFNIEVPKGVYFLLLESYGEVITKKIIKK
jgi:hypothetical protein